MVAALKKRDLVTYVAQDGDGPKVRARVLRAHRDGSCTVESMFALDDEGNDRLCYLGYKYRIGNERLTLLTKPSSARVVL